MIEPGELHLETDSVVLCVCDKELWRLFSFELDAEAKWHLFNGQLYRDTRSETRVVEYEHGLIHLTTEGAATIVDFSKECVRASAKCNACGFVSHYEVFEHDNRVVVCEITSG